MLPTPPELLESDFEVYGSGNVRPHRIRFDPIDPAFLSKDGRGLLTFRVVAPATAIEAKVLVRIDDTVLGHAMDRIGSAGAISVWEVVIEPAAVRFEFSLALLLDGEVPVYVARTGVTSAIERIDRFDLDVEALAVHDVPSWARGAVIYQIFPDRFSRPSAVDAPPEYGAWSEPPTSDSVLGGDLAGIEEHLDHLVELGVDVVYLNPVFTSPSNHKYDTVDYRSVDPGFGGDDALRHLVASLHGRGMRLILDMSLNHCHPRFFAFADVVARGVDSPYAGWFEIRDWPVRVRYRPGLIPKGGRAENRLARLRAESGVPVEEATGDGPAIEPTYGAWYGQPLMPRIDMQHIEARRYMLDVAAYWLREFDIDGWRMDVVRYVDHDLWDGFRGEVRTVRSDAYLLAEVMGDARRWLAGNEFDAVMNYTFRQLMVDYFAMGVIDTDTFLEGLLELTAMYSPAVTAVNQNLLGSHDTPRFLTIAGGDRRSLLLATLVQLTFPGAPGLYYGDELAMEGGDDPDNRRGMTWTAAGNEHHLAVVALTRLRRRLPALRSGTWRLVSVVGDGFAYERRIGDERALVTVNTGTEPVVLPAPDATTVVWSAGAAAPAPGGMRLGAHTGAVVV